ncbi:hypothetical protein GOP47_0020947 [Adiantum capillus-veneris]|uniref:Apple domain-containing protein n=1 Tax=Adiantum capillus-veneris TaxID=13818 RepID=A0A9D4UAJ2_ADICA|nr:hypothetical protein GOP47_0020947 [Adiantum capillus-veneris]
MAPYVGSSSSSSGTWEICGGRARCSFKTATVLVCTCNIMAALYVLRLLSPSYFFSASSSSTLTLFRSSSHTPFSVKYTQAQIQRIREALDIWKKAEPVDLVKRVRQIRRESPAGLLGDEQMEELRADVVTELVQRLEDLRTAGNESRQQQKALEQWRKDKLDELKIQENVARLKGGKAEAQQEVQAAEGMKYLLMAGWSSLLEDAGWFEVTEGEDVPPDSEIEKGIIPGRAVPSECRAEVNSDYDGAAVRWGLTFHVESAADCCQACLDQAKSAKPNQLKCNIWVYCAHKAGCYSPDIYEHKHQECWLKQSNKPRLNFKGKYSPEYRRSHPTAPVVVPWVSGVTSPS